MAALMAELLSLLLLLAAMAVISPAPTEAIKLEEFRTCGDTGFCRRQRTVPRTRTVLRMDDAPTALVYVPGRVPSLCSLEDLRQFCTGMLCCFGPACQVPPLDPVLLHWSPVV